MRHLLDDRARIVSVAAVGLADEGLGTTTVKLVTATHFSSGERDAQARARAMPGER